MLAIIMCAIFEFPFQNKQHGKGKFSRKLNVMLDIYVTGVDSMYV